MFWELFQTSRIEQSNWNAAEATSSAREAKADVRELHQRVQVLEQQCERMILAAMAMAEILRDRLGVTEHEIESKVTEIDLRDGRRDGKFRASPDRCTKCNRPNAANLRQCLYCGVALTSGSFLFQNDSANTDQP